MLMATLMMQAQKGLPINKLFEGGIVAQDKMVETRVKGKEIAKYQLSYFRSLRFEAVNQEVEEMRHLLESDTHQDLYLRIDKPSKTMTIMVQYAPKGQQNRFVCMKVKRSNKTVKDVTVIYMEGRVGSIEKLQELLNNQK